MCWSKRLQEWVDERGWPVIEVARRAGVKVDKLHKWLDGVVEKPRGNDLGKVLGVLGKTEPELFYGILPPSISQLKEIPLLNISDLGELKRGQKPTDYWDGVSMVTVYSDVSENAIGLRLDDDSGEPEFHQGDVVVVELGKPSPPGRHVVAVLDILKRAVFRRFKPKVFGDDSEFTLTALNDHFPAIDVGRTNPGFVVGRATKLIRDI